MWFTIYVKIYNTDKIISGKFLWVRSVCVCFSTIQIKWWWWYWWCVCRLPCTYYTRCFFKHHVGCESGTLQSSLDVSEHPATASKPKYESGPHNVAHVHSVLCKSLLNFVCWFMSFTVNIEVVFTENYRCQRNWTIQTLSAMPRNHWTSTVCI